MKAKFIEWRNIVTFLITSRVDSLLKLKKYYPNHCEYNMISRLKIVRTNIF